MNANKFARVVTECVEAHCLSLEHEPSLTDKNAGTFTLHGLPELSFFLNLARDLKVPIENIETDSRDLGPGCETCGYGGGQEVNVKVKL